MKTKIFSILVAVMAVAFVSCGNNHKNARNNDTPPSVVDNHNSRNSLDYEGTYTGTTPCADCGGIDVSLTLSGSTFTLTTVYLGKENQGQNTFTRTGEYTWDGSGSIITLDNDRSEQYLVGENMLIALDQQGNQVTGDLADMYILRKQ